MRHWERSSTCLALFSSARFLGIHLAHTLEFVVKDLLSASDDNFYFLATSQTLIRWSVSWNKFNTIFCTLAEVAQRAAFMDVRK